MILFILSILLFSSDSLLSQSLPPRTVEYVDLKKYSGLWYEIAKIPNSFQDQCVSGTTARYTPSEDGEILVINSCIDENGEIDKAEGVARVVDKKSNAKLEVSFVSFLGWRPFWGDYWIIGLDENYQWAVVGHPERKYGWILSRVKQPDQQTMNEAFQILKDQGYDTTDFEISLQ
jgi:apolipoprotein D and lipocalin family protein